MDSLDDASVSRMGSNWRSKACAGSNAARHLVLPTQLRGQRLRTFELSPGNAPAGRSEILTHDEQVTFDLKFNVRHTSGKKKATHMLPYWIDLSISDLLQSTGFVAMAITVLTFQFLLPSSRA